MSALPARMMMDQNFKCKELQVRSRSRKNILKDMGDDRNLMEQLLKRSKMQIEVSIDEVLMWTLRSCSALW